jgi:S1-C subfamily serine protease
MRFVFRVSLLFWAFCLSSFASDERENLELVNSSSISSMGVQDVASIRGSERRVREAAVKVIAGGGHGSGTYVKYRGFHLILTAAHVTEGRIGDPYEIQSDRSGSTVGRLIYQDSDLDVAAILVEPIEGQTPMRYRPLDISAEVGTTTLYSGYPSDLNLMSIRGTVAGYEWTAPNGPVIMLHTYGWFGCSGSGVYDDRGRLVGILWGVSIERAYVPQVIEDIIWVTPAHMIDEGEILEGISNLADISDRRTRRNIRRIMRLRI